MARTKNRYALLLLEFKTKAFQESLSSHHIVKSITDVLRSEYGIAGVATSAPFLSVRYLSPITGLCILRMRRHSHQLVLISACSIQTLLHDSVSVRCLGLSGTLKALQPLAGKVYRQQIDTLQAILPYKKKEMLNSDMRHPGTAIP